MCGEIGQALSSSPLLLPASLPSLLPSKWKAYMRRESAKKSKLSPNCRIYKALPAHHRFPLFNLTHTASCLLNPARHREAQHPGLQHHRQEAKLQKRKKKKRLLWGREKGSILFVLWSKHEPDSMKRVKLWRLIEKWDKQKLWKAEGKIVAGSSGSPPLKLLQTVPRW